MGEELRRWDVNAGERVPFVQESRGFSLVLRTVVVRWLLSGVTLASDSIVTRPPRSITQRGGAEHSATADGQKGFYGLLADIRIPGKSVEWTLGCAVCGLAGNSGGVSSSSITFHHTASHNMGWELPGQKCEQRNAADRMPDQS